MKQFNYKGWENTAFMYCDQDSFIFVLCLLCSSPSMDSNDDHLLLILVRARGRKVLVVWLARVRYRGMDRLGLVCTP